MRYPDLDKKILLVCHILFIAIVSVTGSSESYAVSAQSPSDFDSARYFNNLGIEKFNSGDFESAGEYFLRSLESKKGELGPMSVDLASTYTNLGVVSRRMFNIDDAISFYDTAGYIFLNNYGPDYINLGAVYLNQGNILRDKRDISSSLAYYNNAMRIFIKNDMTLWLGTLYNNIGIAHETGGNYEKAIEYYYRSINIRKLADPAAVAIPAGNLAICYLETGDIEKADEYYRLAIDAISDNIGSDNVNYAINLQNYGLFLIKSAGEHERGHELLIRALNIYRSYYGDKGQNISRTYMNIGYSFEVSGNHDAALRYYHNSIISNSDSFDSDDFSENPVPGSIVYSIDYMLSSLKHKANSLYLISLERERLSNLSASLSAFKRAIEFIEYIRMGHRAEDSGLLLSENEHQTYMQAIRVAWEIFEMTGDPLFVEEAFMFSERSKAASLLSSIRDVEARSFGGVPEVLIDREQGLKSRIAAYRELIYEEQRNIKADSDRINFWQERIFSLELELTQLLSLLEKEYPNYYALKYKQDMSGMKSVMQQLGGRDALVSYVHDDTVIYIFALTKNNFRFFISRPESPPGPELDKFLDVLSNGNLDRKVNEDYYNFTKSSRYFYNLLIDPVLTYIRGKRLIIVPDGMLAYIPFELLLTSDKSNGRTNYKDLPYLIRDFSVSYSYSANLWKESIRKTSVASNKMLAMAPNYNITGIDDPETVSSRQYYRDRLMPLPGAREEAIEVAKIMSGRALVDNDASEGNFKNMAGDFQILHFAMHTLLDDLNPMYSKLVFSEPGEEGEDGFLNTYEIYNMGLNASLAVLSACRSGFGIINRGEGIMSLARGFLYAGVPSIVMTNWEIEDKSGAEIMIGFYGYLLKGYRKDEALRQARLDFLDDADFLRSHPYFWGAYVCIGNPDEIYRTYRNLFPLAIFTVLLFIMIFVVWRGQLRRS